MNTIDKILADSKTLKQAAEKVFELATKVGYPMPNAKRWVQMYKFGTQDPTALLAKVKEYDREQTRLFLERRTPLDMIEKAIAGIDIELAKFFEDAAKDPFYQFSWGDRAVKTAARRKVYLEVRQTLVTNTVASLEKWNELLGYIRDEALQMASSPARSTSPMSNFAETCLMEAKANITRNWDHNIGEITWWFKNKAKYDAGE